MRVLIIEDEEHEASTIENICREAAEHNSLDPSQLEIHRATTLSEARERLNQPDFSYHLIIADIMLPDGGYGYANGMGKLPVTSIEDELLHADILREAKFIVHSGQEEYVNQQCMRMIHSGAHSVILKGSEGVLKAQLIRAFRDIRQETVWSMIGRFAPAWKRKAFREFTLWKELETGIEQDVAIIWCDMSKSTQFSELQKDHMKHRLLTPFFKEFITANAGILEQEAFRGMIDKFLGDEIMAYFTPGADESPQSVCARAVHAAKKISTGFHGWYKKQLETRPLARPRSAEQPNLRILVHHGPVIWGVLGSPAFSCLTVMTSTLAIGRRLFEHYNVRGERAIRLIKEGEICVTDPVEHFLRGAEEFTFGGPRAARRVRNFGNMVVYPLADRGVGGARGQVARAGGTTCGDQP